jgi:phage portal protein BeeE
MGSGELITVKYIETLNPLLSRSPLTITLSTITLDS